jgi:hypothetical protein
VIDDSHLRPASARCQYCTRQASPAIHRTEALVNRYEGVTPVLSFAGRASPDYGSSDVSSTSLASVALQSRSVGSPESNHGFASADCGFTSVRRAGGASCTVKLVEGPEDTIQGASLASISPFHHASVVVEGSCVVSPDWHSGLLPSLDARSSIVDFDIRITYLT